ncbi:MAG TPA: MFS transporter [Anaerolineae bacterium]|nr:MFS transporter [Anaerolineae bacterium]
MNGVARYLRQFQSFGRNARFFLLSEVIVGLSFSIYSLIFNLFIVTEGYPRSFLGELQSLPNLIALFGAVPAGMLADQIGRKRSLLLANVGRTIASFGIIMSPGPNWLRLSMITFGVASSLWMVSASPFMMENSTKDNRNALYSAHFGLTILIGFFGTLVGGYLPSFFGIRLGVDVESAMAYAATLGVTVVLSAISLIPVFMLREKPRRVSINLDTFLPWRNLSNPGMAVRIFIPNIVISMGAAILIPYMNLFFKETFPISDRTLGTVFAISAVVTGTVTLASPLLAERWGRIRALTFAQLASVPFLLTIGFAPFFWIAAIAFWVRAALMNMGGPLYEAFAMEQVRERERATISGLMGMSWNIGWTIGPYVSGYMQSNPNIGFRPIFLITCSFYVLAAILARVFFQRLDDRQRRTALFKKIGVIDLTPERLG